jgi:predicted Na+-dependent transporter
MAPGNATAVPLAKADVDNTALGIATYIMLGVLFFGLAATVETGQFRSKFKECKGIACGLCCQFFIVPALGYASTQIFDLDAVYGADPPPW